MGDWPFDEQTGRSPRDYLSGIGSVFATFDARTQDSGNVSFGVEAAGRRWFVKTPGDPADETPSLPHEQRIALLANAQRVATAVRHPALPRLFGIVGSAWGPMLVYEWVAGELLRAPPGRRDDPESVFQRFRRLPSDELTSALEVLLEAHLVLCEAGWIASDFYDGALIYDFVGRQMRLIDVDHYHLGPFVNRMGRMFGSTRFMAPEEFERGALVDERTTVFNLGRAISVFLGDGGLGRTGFRGSQTQHQVMAKACDPDPAARFRSVADMWQAWRS